MEKYVLQIASELSIAPKRVQATIELLDGGATVPFIARYRKELTGSLDEVAIAAIRDRIAQLRELDKRREAILESMRQMGKLTPELQAAFMAADTLTRLEDLYLPFRPKRRTKATEAKEKGLEPLADILMAQDDQIDLLQAVLSFINEEKGVKTIEEALSGARHIIAERVSEDPQARANMRELFLKKGKFKAKVIPGKESQAQKYKDYFDWEEDIASAPSHRILAMRRAEKENFITLSALPEEEEALAILCSQFVKGEGPASEQVKMAVIDSYHRLLGPSIENEVRAITKKRADEEAIKVFAENLRQLLLASPLGEKPVLAIDPGFRTGCKVVCLNEQGKLLHHDTIYPHEPQKQIQEAGETIRQLCQQYQIQAIAIGNGTASRETEQFIKSLQLPKHILIITVNESGASVYSASEVARREFPNYDITVRGAISIGRRLMDPLAELVKIEPRSIGVGQYQHDVDQTALKKSLDDVVISCVNAVGVEVNTASRELLMYVSGLGPTLAQNIVDYRNLYGPFKNRQELKKVPRFGEKVFEQAAGFLRIRNGENPLDASAVHPESYHIVEQMAADLNCTVQDLMQSQELRNKINLKKYVTDKVGLPTLQDILNELAKPGRDPRQQFEPFSFDERIKTIEDLRVGMRLPGIVANITDFGVFVDIGIHEYGLIHRSQLADRYVEHPSEVVKIYQHVMVTVTEVDLPRRRISLSMKSSAHGPATASPKTKSDAKPLAKDKKGKQSPPEEDMAVLIAKLKAKFR